LHQPFGAELDEQAGETEHAQTADDLRQ